MGITADAIFADELLDRVRFGPGHHGAETHAVSQQIANGDGALRGYSVVQFRGDGPEHPTIGKLRQPRLDGIVQAQLTVLDQNH